LPRYRNQLTDGDPDITAIGTDMRLVGLSQPRSSSATLAATRALGGAFGLFATLDNVRNAMSVCSRANDRISAIALAT
jgi:hypothetical protein